MSILFLFLVFIVGTLSEVIDWDYLMHMNIFEYMEQRRKAKENPIDESIRREWVATEYDIYKDAQGRNRLRGTNELVYIYSDINAFDKKTGRKRCRDFWGDKYMNFIMWAGDYWD